MFITFEGGEGTGKTTQIALLQQRLIGQGHRVATYREPGGSPGAEAIRDLVLTGTTKRWHAVEELLLFSAARHELVRTAIQPDLKAGKLVLCDRFFDSSFAYQGRAGGIAEQALNTITALATNGLKPDMTLLLDLDPNLGLARAGKRLAHESKAATKGEDRFENKTRLFHHAVRQAFLDLARREPARIKVLNANQSSKALAEEVWAHVQTALS